MQHSQRGSTVRLVVASMLVSVLPISAAFAQDLDEAAVNRSGKLLLTAGVSQVEGAAGGGLTPWAVIAGYGTRDQVGANAYLTEVVLSDFRLRSAGLALGWHDRIELSLSRQRFDTQDVGSTLGLGQGFAISQDTVGVKWRLLGDAVLDQDTWVPQISVGLQHKRNHEGDLLAAIGAARDSDTEVYLSATKLLLAHSLLINGTLRMTRANQFGILGFGGDLRDSHSLQVETSVAYLLNRELAVGAEYRSKPDNLGIANEDDAWDVFVAWAPNKTISVTVAYVDLGNIVIADHQHGLYASLQFGF
ncbi:MAG: DUF3034 family protein [Lysobacteraceae bacterium]